MSQQLNCIGILLFQGIFTRQVSFVENLG